LQNMAAGCSTWLLGMPFHSTMALQPARYGIRMMD
jgi:hypothetical protein